MVLAHNLCSSPLQLLSCKVPLLTRTPACTHGVAARKLNRKRHSPSSTPSLNSCRPPVVPLPCRLRVVADSACGSSVLPDMKMTKSECGTTPHSASLPTRPPLVLFTLLMSFRFVQAQQVTDPAGFCCDVEMRDEPLLDELRIMVARSRLSLWLWSRLRTSIRSWGVRGDRVILTTRDR